MKREIADKWIEALMSGGYVQGKQSLCTGALINCPLYCCLGVLEDLYIKEHPEDDYVKEHLITANYLSLNVQEWARLKSETGSYSTENVRYDHTSTLAYDNDHRNKTFPEIAEIIREKVDIL